MKRRNTESKELVLSILSNSTKAMSQDAIERKTEGKIDRATIYRILNRFCEDGIAHKVVADDGKRYFAICVKCDDPSNLPNNHFHFRCTECETIECMPEIVKYSQPENYTIKKVNCVLIGVCSECA
ncbi:Fur family transcriptional regulator [Brumimicrobium mesophilum]|uniref:Fur family transcriptional regulator n=1 Tax=Brumimicrobium mesophilum TaxID=392717 RepID=UPI000D1402A0|nr:transcriptional repressor [Brumimicrobium mesophilum]